MNTNESDIDALDPRFKIVLTGIQSNICGTENNTSIYHAENFDERIEAIDFLEFHIIDQIDAIFSQTNQEKELILLKDGAERVKSKLEKINTNLFQKLRKKIRGEGCAGKEFKNLVDKHVRVNMQVNKTSARLDYDNLDIFVNGLTAPQPIPEVTRDLEPEMIYYQKTPARVIFALVEECQLTSEDVFFDLGSGLGQAVILVNLLAGIKTVGVEFEPAFCNYAQACAARLNLPDISFINADARKADYTRGTAFFKFTPFRGQILHEVLEILRKESRQRKIKIITYGPCTEQVALQSWLNAMAPFYNGVYALSVFNSI